jgi:hypothetical protein
MGPSPNAPSGVARILMYGNSRSRSLTSAWVYTPPNYDRSSAPPIVYLLPGSEQVWFQWALIDAATEMLDHLILTRAIKPMLLVVPIRQHRDDAPTPPPRSRSARRARLRRETETLSGLIRLIERRFKVSSSRRYRSVVALSTSDLSGRLTGLHYKVLPRQTERRAGDGGDGTFFQGVHACNRLLPEALQVRVACVSVHTSDAGRAREDRAHGSARITGQHPRHPSVAEKVLDPLLSCIASRDGHMLQSNPGATMA